MNNITETSLVVTAEKQVAGEFKDGEVAILNLEDGVYYSLNEVGGRIWSLIQEPQTVNQLRDALLLEYEVDQERCTTELVALLEELYERGLIDIVA